MNNRVLAMILFALVGVCGFLGWRIWELTQTDLSRGATQSSPPITETDAAPRFLRAWKTAETTDYIAFAKVGLSGNGLAAFTEDIVVQRNGQRLVNRDSSIIYERDGETETCRQTRRELFCTPPAPVPTAEDREAQLRKLLTGENWSYRAVFLPQADCYQLRLDMSKGPVTPEYGLETDYCFDPMTGAVKTKVVRKVNRTESYEASEISNDFDESELRGVFPAAILERFFQ